MNGNKQGKSSCIVECSGFCEVMDILMKNGEPVQMMEN